MAVRPWSEMEAHNIYVRQTAAYRKPKKHAR